MLMATGMQTKIVRQGLATAGCGRSRITRERTTTPGVPARWRNVQREEDGVVVGLKRVSIGIGYKYFLVFSFGVQRICYEIH